MFRNMKSMIFTLLAGLLLASAATVHDPECA